MRILRVCVLALFLVVLIMNIVTGLLTKKDQTLPVVQLDSDLLHVSLSDGDDAFLSGVTAFDE